MDFKPQYPVLYNVCRICLNMNQRMFPISQNIDCYYQLIISNKVTYIEDKLPLVLCWECSSRMKQFQDFRTKAVNSYRLMTEFVVNTDLLTIDQIMSIDRRANNLESSIKPVVYGVMNISDGNNVQESTSRGNVKQDGDSASDTGENKFTDMMPGLYHTEFVADVFIPKIEMADENDARDSGKRQPRRDDDSDAVSKKRGQKKVGSAKEKCKIGPAKKQALKKSTNKVGRPRKLVKSVTEEKKEMKRKSKYDLDESIITIIKKTPEEEIENIKKRAHSQKYIEAPYKCEKCYLGYSSLDDYNKHARRHTDVFGTFECSVCKLRKTSKKFLDYHMNVHNKSYACKHCKFTSVRREAAVGHMRLHKGTTNKYECPHCSHVSDTRSGYMGHLRLQHASSFVCSLCGHTFLSELGVKQHKKTTHKHQLNDKLEGPRCETCELVFLSQAAYDKHLLLSAKHVGNQGAVRRFSNYHQKSNTIREYKQQVQTSVNCSQCGEEQKSLHAYRVHLKYAHPGAPPDAAAAARPTPVICDQCGRTFPNKWGLEYHMWRHSGVKLFKCTLCDKSYSQKAALVLHMNTHSDQRTTYDCPVCNKQFASPSNRGRHIASVHKGKRFVCELCDKTFTTKEALQGHVDHVHNKIPWPKRSRPSRKLLLREEEGEYV